MRTLLIDNIAELVTNDPSLGEGPLGVITDAAIAVSGGRVTWVGHTSRAPAADEHWGAAGAAVVPGSESHSHLVFAGDRGHEFAARFWAGAARLRVGRVGPRGRARPVPTNGHPGRSSSRARRPMRIGRMRRLVAEYAAAAPQLSRSSRGTVRLSPTSFGRW